MLFSSGPGQRTDLPMVQDTTSGFFIRSEGDRLIMGYGGEHELDGHNNSLDWAWLESVMEAGHERFPWILDLPMDQRASWAGPTTCPRITCPSSDACLGLRTG
jgi:sarcosine oxidase subunit beta